MHTVRGVLMSTENQKVLTQHTHRFMLQQRCSAVPGTEDHTALDKRPTTGQGRREGASPRHEVNA